LRQNEQRRTSDTLKSEIAQLASKLGKADVYFLIKMLSEKEDAVRYNSFLLLQNSSLELPYTYEHWNELEKKDWEATTRTSAVLASCSLPKT
jgi:hypothetical protein